MSRSSDPAQPDAPAPGFTASIAAVLGNLSALLGARMQLAALELGELRDNLVRLAVYGALGLLALILALAGWTALVVFLAWDALGWLSLLLVALAWSLAAFLLLRQGMAMLTRERMSLPATMAELRKDHDVLLQGDAHG